MNRFGLLTLVLGAVCYRLGLAWARIPSGRCATHFSMTAAAVLALPAFLYAFYYARLLGEPIWLYQLRTIPGTELLAAPAGFLAAWLQKRIIPRIRLSGFGRRFLVPVAFGFALALPYLKPLLRPLDHRQLRDHWEGDVCRQSTVSTCGPASASTIVRRLGGNVTEPELAAESFTSRSGTENWYLARALRRHGFQTDFMLGDPMEVPLPAIAGVRLKNLGGSGHFIALIERKADVLVVADPMVGQVTNSVVGFRDDYEFTGFFLVIKNLEPR